MHHVGDDGEEATNGLVQTLTVDIENGFRVRRLYISPSVSGEVTEKTVRAIIKDTKGRGVILVD